MQPTKPIPSDIKTIQDYLFQQFSATEAVQVQNILSTPYFFRYCVNEEIVTPDPISRRVVNREYEEHTFEPGQTMTLMGGAAYIFISGVANQYVFEKHGAEATGDIAKMIQAADLAFIQKVSYEQPKPVTRVEAPSQNVGNHNPNAVNDDNGNLPPQQNTVSTGANDDAFANLDPSEVMESDENFDEFDWQGNHYDKLENGRTRMNKNFVKKEVYEKAREEYRASRVSAH